MKKYNQNRSILRPGAIVVILPAMIIIRVQREKLRFCCFKSSFSSGASSVPILPSPSTVPIISSEIVKISSFKATKRRSRKFSGNGGGFGPNGSPLNSLVNSTAMIGTFSNSKGPQQEEFVNLFSIYGNILVKESGGDLLIPFSSENLGEFQKYPLESNLMNLFENSVRFWYEIEGKEDKKLPSILSINAPSRSSTWELTKFLVGKSGKSHLAIIPFSMFYELLQTCGNFRNSTIGNNWNMKEEKALGDFILNNITSGFNPKKKISPFVSNSYNTISTSSRAVIEVVEYLFACLEASLGGKEGANENERFTLLLDGFEEFLQAKKGGEVILKDLCNWTNLFESSGRKLVFGGRNQNLSEEIDVEQEEQNNENDEEQNGSSIINISGNGSGSNTSNSNNNNNNSNKPPYSALPFQAITDFFIKATGTKSEKSNENVSITNVKIEGQIMKLFVNGPKNDKRQFLKYSQQIGIDRKKDILDRNILILKSVATNRWNMKLKLNLKSKHDFPSNHQEIWGKLSETGKGILVKRRLSRDEINEIILYVLGNKIKGVVSLESLSEAVEKVSQIRFDPTKFSSDDLSHLLAERQISMNSLTKYEKRFINCISTATTQTRFDEISLPEKTVSTLRSLTTLPLTHPELFTQGVLKNSLTGVLLFGPPGTGKTMLARAVAQESGAVFLAVNMSNIFDMWVGEGEKNVKGLFNLARKFSPSIIFIDEIDALLERRSSISGRSSRLEIVNEFMSQWDGLSSNLNSGVVVMGATNRPFVLDDAVLRRLPRRLLIDLPDSKNRLNILINLLKDNLCENELLVALPEMAEKMNFYSGSDLKNVAITAALKSAMRLASTGDHQMIVSKNDFEEAMREVPASLSDQMDSLVELRKWNQIYGETKSEGHAQRKFGFS